jgi:hypothetical protein
MPEQIRLIRDQKLLDSARKRFGFETDAALAAWLKIDKQEIYAVRAGRRTLGFVQRLKILDHISFATGIKLVASLANESLAEEFLAWSQRTANVQAEHHLRHIDWQQANVALLDATKLALGADTDAALARYLKLKPNTISMIRSGKSGLGDRPRLKILKLILENESFDPDAIEAIADDPDKIAEAIEIWAMKQESNAS